MMKPSTKAALVSALIFPGLGHLVLKRPMRGCLFIVPALLAIGFLLRTTLALASALVAEIDSGKLALDPLDILARIHASGVDNPATNAASLVILLCWVGSVADAFWLGRAR
nr:DUF6677 family protein [uncultured Duganella sp.]